MASGCVATQVGGGRDGLLQTEIPPLPAEPHLAVLVLGDWGTGDDGQRSLADTMASVHAVDPPDLVITVGDNFYPRGVESTEDPLWEEAFESVYRGAFWDNLPFRPTLGNHDHRGSAQSQVEYSRFSVRWDMPAFYYAINSDVAGVGLVRLFALDTDPIDEEEPEADIQLEWLDARLAEPAQWRIAFGHHPFVSSGYHGGSDDMIELALPSLRAADLYVAGHDHVTEMLRIGSVPQAVCGGGAASDNAYGLQPGSGSLYGFTAGGWCYLRVYRDAIAVDLIDATGTVKYRHFIRKQPTEP